jgi:signal peptidase I
MDNSPADNTGIYEVPDGHYFMMGDNRDNSTDSRFVRYVGFVPHENLVGPAQILFFSFDDRTRFWELWRWPISIRLSRLFNLVD